MSGTGMHSGIGRALALVAARPWRTVAAVVAVGLSLSLPLLLGNLAWSMAPLARGLAAVSEATVFAAPGTSSNELKTLQSRLAETPGVQSVASLSREAALAELGSRADLAGALADLKVNPLPDAFIVQLAGAPPAQEAAVATIRKLARVDAVQHDAAWARKLAAVSRTAKASAVVLGGLVLLLAVGVALGTVWRMTAIDARERRILDLLGAPPALVPAGGAWLGALILGAGALVGAGLTMLVVALSAPLVQEIGAAYGTDWTLPPAPTPWLAGWFVGAATIGAVVGRLRARQR